MPTPESRAQRAPAVLLGYQQRWVADRSVVKVGEKSRRIGFTWASSAEAVLEAAASSGQDVWYVGYNREMAEEFIRDSADWARHFGKVASAIEEQLLDDEDRQILAFTIRFDSGFRITALSSRPSNLRGKQGYVILDEAAFHDKLDELLKAALALIMWGGRVAVLSTHDGADNAFHALVNDIRAGKLRYSLHRVTLDDALADGLYQRICLRLGREWSPEAEAQWRQELIEFYGDGADEELFCVPRNSGGRYLSQELIESRMGAGPVLRLEAPAGFAQRDDAEREAWALDWCRRELAPLLAALPQDRMHFFGEDFGRTADLTVIAPAMQTQQLVRRVPFLVELRNVPFRQQEQILFFVVDRLPRFVAGAMDATGNGQYLAEVAMQRYGAGRIAQVHLTEKWYSENLPPFKAAHEDGTIEYPRDVDVRDDVRRFEVIKGIPKLPTSKTKGQTGQRHGDAGIALVLMYAASRMEMEAYGYTPVKVGPEQDRHERRVVVTAGFRTLGGVL